MSASCFAEILVIKMGKEEGDKDETMRGEGGKEIIVKIGVNISSFMEGIVITVGEEEGNKTKRRRYY